MVMNLCMKIILFLYPGNVCALHRYCLYNPRGKATTKSMKITAVEYEKTHLVLCDKDVNILHLMQ